MALPTTSSVVMDSLHYRKWGGYFKGTKIPDGMETVSGAVVKIMESYSAYDITSGVHTNAHEDAFSVPRTNLGLVGGFGAFKVRRSYACALHLHCHLGY